MPPTMGAAIGFITITPAWRRETSFVGKYASLRDAAMRCRRNQLPIVTVETEIRESRCQLCEAQLLVPFRKFLTNSGRYSKVGSTNNLD
jgi:hypothetical protein